MNNKKYWNEENQISLEKYYYTNSTTDKEIIFTNELYKPIEALARQVLYTYTSKVDEDKIQDILTKVSTYTLPNLKEDKLKAGFSLLWLTMQRVTFTHYQKAIIKPEYYCTSTTSINPEYYSTALIDNEYEAEAEVEEQRKIILTELDKRIEAEEVLNKKTTFFLILLKQYIIDNNFDVRGFRTYCCERLNIKESGFSNLCSLLKITNQDFNKELIDNSKAVINKAKRYNNRKK